MELEAQKTYIQKNPLLGRMVLRVEHLRESVWGWNICDVTAVRLDQTPKIEQRKGLASSVYDNLGLEEIPNEVFDKLYSIAKLYRALAGDQRIQPQANESMANCLDILIKYGIIDDSTYSPERMQIFAQQYEEYTKSQKQQVTDVIDVHK